MLHVINAQTIVIYPGRLLLHNDGVDTVLSTVTVCHSTSLIWIFCVSCTIPRGVYRGGLVYHSVPNNN